MPEKDRRQPPFWLSRTKLAPRIRARIRSRIETTSEARGYTSRNLSALSKCPSTAALARAIDQCDSTRLCRQVLCAGCARKFRLWLASEIYPLATRASAFVATILLDDVREAELGAYDLSALKDRLRKKLRRCGLDQAVGGIEFAYRASENIWVAHVHLLVVGSIDNLRAPLRERFGEPGKKKVLCSPVNDEIAQLTYLMKFSTYHRPGTQVGSRKARAFPLKPKQIQQLGKLADGKKFEDFLFLLGFRRSGPRLLASKS